MIAAQVMGNDVTIGLAGSLGNFELNVFKPVLIFNLLQSIRLLADGALSFRLHCVQGIVPNPSRLQHYLDQCLMLATALTPAIGYDKTAKIVQKAHTEDLTLKQAAISLGILTEADYDRLIDPSKMV